MRDIMIPSSATEWEQSMTCPTCGTQFVAETSDLNYDGFKKPGTYFFDGSADSAGYNYKFFVYCPAKCSSNCLVIADDTIGALVKKKLVNKPHKR